MPALPVVDTTLAPDVTQTLPADALYATVSPEVA